MVFRMVLFLSNILPQIRRIKISLYVFSRHGTALAWVLWSGMDVMKSAVQYSNHAFIRQTDRLCSNDPGKTRSYAGTNLQSSAFMPAVGSEDEGRQFTQISMAKRNNVYHALEFSRMHRRFTVQTEYWTNIP